MTHEIAETQPDESFDLRAERVSKSSNYSTGKEAIIGIDTGSGAVTVTLASNRCEEGRVYVIKDEGGNANSNNITVNTEGSETIDGDSSLTLTVNHDKVTVYSDGSNWFTR